LWDETSGNIVVFRHKRVVFGVRSSPFVLAAVMEQHFCASGEKTVTCLRDSFNVDNLATSLECEDELIPLQRDSRVVMAFGGFELRRLNGGKLRLQLMTQAVAKVASLSEVKSRIFLSRGVRKFIALRSLQMLVRKHEELREKKKKKREGREFQRNKNCILKFIKKLEYRRLTDLFWILSL
jgi:hypothetical protein